MTEPLLHRLKSRKIAQWTIAYLSAAWLVLQVVDVIGEQFGWPAWLTRGITAALGVGLFATLVLAWFHGEKGHQRVTRLEVLLLAGILLAAGFVIRAVARGGDAAESIGSRTTSITRDDAAIAIVPFGPTTPDSTLERLGRDLVVTIGATLDGIESIRIIDPLTVLAQTRRGGDALSLAQALALADRLGAGRLLHGTLARSGRHVRLDAALYTVDGARPSARVTVEHDADHVSAFTDSVAFSLVRQLWTGATPVIPSPAALATSSVEALRAYLDGEHALAGAEMPQALAAFERAFDIDSTYWFAYWRSLYPRTYEGTRADSAALARVIENRDALPPADRLLVEVGMEGSARRKLALLEGGVRRFPTHWPMWYTYANLLVHWTPYLGTSSSTARAALERVVELNPGFGPAWEHLMWMIGMQRDSAAARVVLERLETFVMPGAYRFNDDMIQLYRTVYDAVAHGGRLSDGQLPQIAAYVAGYSGSIPVEAFGSGLLIADVPHAQMQLADAVFALDPAGELATALWYGQALGWSARGAWDSTTVVADRWARMNGSPAAALSVYGLLATGAALGALPAEQAAQRRPAAPPTDAPAPARAAFAWTDGVVAYAAGDGRALADAQHRLAASGSQLSLLDGSLDALALALAGRHEDAARLIIVIEEDAADRFLHSNYRWNHPYVSSVNRLLAGRWLLEAGDAGAAAQLLTYVEAVLPGGPPLEAVNRTVGTLGFYYRARAEESMGRLTEARIHYARFVEQFDRPVPALAPLVEDARDRLARLAQQIG